MPIFSITRTATALSTSADLLTLVAANNKPLRVLMVDLKGMGTTSSANEVLMSRSTGGTGAGGALAAEKVNSNSAAASFSAFTTWGAQPTLAARPIWAFGPNTNGGIDKFVAVPGAEISVPASGQLSFRAAAGTGPVTIAVLVEEIDG
ncbi:hypothetical protein [Azohydromonas aeria]|uniref:hypothetical protein n=1 Tax=Azohydromonas aeria TaxID=2590212 RepID=UPI0012FB315E|nr:hypothetical protein [Azohydromonas aeria]